ncbi:MAG TPA: hypothetical protein VFG72_04465 [Marmoricola sp.]|nr:hypothetical protein [Marmoricola sp.]
MSMSSRLRRASLRRRPRKVFLHIGAMKTGTTYLQHLMDENRQNLAKAGFLFPGESWRDQWLAVLDVLASTAGTVSRTPESQGMWQKVTAEMLAHRGRASVLSMEFLSYADPEQAAQVLAAFPDREVHVVITVRDARSAVPAQWQTSCRMAGTVPLPRLITAMGKPVDDPGEGRAAKLLQRTQGIRRMLDVWTPLVGAERVHVVTVPPKGSDPTLLWTRFAGVLGLRPSLCRPPTTYIHTSLGYTSSELLRLLNVALGPDAKSPETRRVKRELVGHLLHHTDEEPPIRLNRRGLRLAARWNQAVRGAITDSGVHLVGDLDDLTVGPPPPDAPAELTTPSTQELLEVALVSRAFLESLRERLAADVSGTTTAHPGAGPTAPARVPEGEPETVLEETVDALAGLVRECIDLNRKVAAPLP